MRWINRPSKMSILRFSLLVFGPIVPFHSFLSVFPRKKCNALQHAFIRYSDFPPQIGPICPCSSNQPAALIHPSIYFSLKSTRIFSMQNSAINCGWLSLWARLMFLWHIWGVFARILVPLVPVFLKIIEFSSSSLPYLRSFSCTRAQWRIEMGCPFW